MRNIPKTFRDEFLGMRHKSRVPFEQYQPLWIQVGVYGYQDQSFSFDGFSRQKPTLSGLE